MTTEEAIKILDPETRRETLKMIPVHERISVDQEACRLAVAALRAQQELAKDTNVRPNPPLTLGELRQMDDEILSRGSSSYCRTCGIRRNCVIGPCARCDTKKVPPSEWVKYENPELTLYPQEAHHGSN